jgi:hypothetical protein
MASPRIARDFATPAVSAAGALSYRVSQKRAQRPTQSIYLIRFGGRSKRRGNLDK